MTKIVNTLIAILRTPRFLTALHGMQTRSSDENSVCLSIPVSVYPSIKRVICDKMEERYVQIFYTIRKNV